MQVLLPFGQFLLSADWLGTLKVWDMASGQCVQTMQQAHKEPIMGVLQWEVSLLPFSLPVIALCLDMCDVRSVSALTHINNSSQAMWGFSVP